MSAPPPRLSVVIVEVSDTVARRTDFAHLARCLEALNGQIDPPSMEILVPYLARGYDEPGIEEIKTRFPAVRLLPIEVRAAHDAAGGREHHDELRARGLAAARGDLVGLLEDHARPDPHWCARAVEAHRAPYAGIGGAIENDVDRPLNWAVYFCDFYHYLNPVPAGESFRVSDANVVYKRSALEAIRPVWEESFREPEVNAALAARGERLALSPEIVLYQHRVGLELRDAIKERIIWGRSYAVIRSAGIGRGQRLLYVALSPALPALLWLRMARSVRRKGRCVGSFLRASPLIGLLTGAWSLGEAVGYVTGRSDGGRHVPASPESV